MNIILIVIYFSIGVYYMFSIFYNAKADIKGSKDFPNIKGAVYFKGTSNGVLVTAKIAGLPQSKDKCVGRFFKKVCHNFLHV